MSLRILSFSISATLYILLLSSCQEKKIVIEQHPAEVTTQKIILQTIPVSFENVGVIQSSHPVEIRARVTGYIDQISYTEGEPVKQGDLLFQIDPREFEATLDSSRAELAKQNAILWESTRSVERIEPLYKQKAASLRDLDNAIAKKLSAEADVESAKSRVIQAELNLEYTSIKSPISGLSEKANLYQGALVSGSQGTLLTTISLIDPIWVTFSISESSILYVQESREKKRLLFPLDNNFDVEVILANSSIYPEKGKLTFKAPTYQQSTGTLQLRGVMPNPDGILLPGQFVRVRLIGAFKPEAIMIPQKAVLQSQKGMFVFVVNDEKKAEIRPIEPGEWHGNDWIIESGLQQGDEVIIEGVNKIQAGMPVRIRS